MTKDEILAILREELPHLKEEFRVIRIGLFGSYANGEAREDSDIDLLVELDPPVGLFKFVALEDYLSERLGTRVDLVTPDSLKPVMRSDVLEGTVYA